MIMTLWTWKHTRCLWAGPAVLLTTHGRSVREGLDAKANFRSVPARGGIISLDIPFIELQGGPLRPGPQRNQPFLTSAGGWRGFPTRAQLKWATAWSG